MGGLEKMANTIQDAYRIVLNDMLNSGCGLLVGEYDATNGDEQFMHGISLVMEWIAYRVSEEDYNEFNDLFIKNLIKSEQKAQGIKCYKCAELSGCHAGQQGGKKNCKCFSPKGIDNELEM
jgi:hypothetical protein